LAMYVPVEMCCKLLTTSANTLASTGISHTHTYDIRLSEFDTDERLTWLFTTTTVETATALG